MCENEKVIEFEDLFNDMFPDYYISEAIEKFIKENDCEYYIGNNVIKHFFIFINGVMLSIMINKGIGNIDLLMNKGGKACLYNKVVCNEIECEEALKSILKITGDKKNE